MATVRRASKLDWGLAGLLGILSAVGLMTLWSASHGPDGEIAAFASKQILWLVIGFCAMFAISKFDYRHLQNHAWTLYGALLLLLVAVMIIGKTSMGAQRWLSLGPVKLQPSEFMKIGIAVVLAHYFSMETVKPPYGFAFLAKPFALTIFPAALVLLQPDLGTAMLILCVAGAITVFQGVAKRVAVTALIAVPVGAPLFWSILKEYQKNRILTFLSPERDPMGAGYHIIQSKIAIGSGQIFGKGYLNGTQSHLRFLPERHTDFIFAVFAEEWGLLGSFVILAFFAVLILWGLDIAAKSRDTFGRLLAIGLTAILFAHVVVNTGMVMGLLPVVGVPLPLFSYGGSSVLTTSIIAGVLLSIRRKRFTV